jgi:hypothetical protein
MGSDAAQTPDFIEIDCFWRKCSLVTSAVNNNRIASGQNHFHADHSIVAPANTVRMGCQDLNSIGFERGRGGAAVSDGLELI